MHRFVVTLGLISLLAAGSVASSQSAVAKQSKGRTMVFKVSLVQEATHRTVRPPDGDANDLFTTSLQLHAVGAEFGHVDGYLVGKMAFSWWFTGAFACGSQSPGCKGTTNVRTVTTLPGGTITAGANSVSLGAKGEIIPVQSGTGIFKGATGTVTVAPGGLPVDVFTLVLPA